MKREFEDVLPLCQAMLHTVQVRLLAAALRGKMNDGVVDECVQKLRSAADELEDLKAQLSPSRKLRPIPIAAAKRLANDYGYDQVMIYARRVGDEPDPHGEHMTTYGASKAHCAAAAKIGAFLKHKIMGWPERE